MDLLLIDPPRVYWGFGGGMGFFSPPVGLATLAGFLEHQGVDVGVLDCNALQIGWDGLATEIVKRRPRSVGVSSSMTCYVPDAARCLEVAKQVDPVIHTLGGGLQFTLTPDEAFRRCAALDVVVRGDGEYTTLELLQGLERDPPSLEGIPGVSYRRGGTIVHNPDRQPLHDLDSLPFPAWHMLPMHAYRLPVVPPRWGNYAIVVTTRGCPYHCRFCSPRQGQAPYRAMSAERVLQMLDELYYVHNVRVFWFSDLSFNADSVRTEHILDGIIERGWKVRIALDGTRTDLVLRDRHLLPKMKRAGVFLACLGVESYAEQELREYNKGTTAKKAEEAVALVKKHSIHAWCFFMLGNLRHGREDILSMLDFAKRLDPTIAIFAIVTPIPGTPFYEHMEAQGRIVEPDWSRYDMAHPVMRIDKLGRQEILDLIDYCSAEFYKRPSKIIRHGILGDQFARYTYRFLRFVGAARQLKEGRL